MPLDPTAWSALLALWLSLPAPVVPYEPPLPPALSRSARRIFTSDDNQTHLGVGGYTDGDQVAVTVQLTTGRW